MANIKSRRTPHAFVKTRTWDSDLSPDFRGKCAYCQLAYTNEVHVRE